MLVSSLIKASMRKLGTVASGEDLTPEEQKDALESLQSMLRSWAAEKLHTFSTVKEQHTLAPPAYEYTWGTGGDIATARPNQVISATIDDSSGVTHDVDIIQEGRYRQISVKATIGRPYALFPKYDYPLVTITLYPVPDSADTLNLYSLKPFTETSSFDSWDDELQMPLNYEEPLIYSLALRLAPEFGKKASAELIAMARTSYEKLINLNAGNYIEPVRIVIPAGDTGAGYSINSDGYR